VKIGLTQQAMREDAVTRLKAAGLACGQRVYDQEIEDLAGALVSAPLPLIDVTTSRASTAQLSAPYGVVPFGTESLQLVLHCVVAGATATEQRAADDLAEAAVAALFEDAEWLAKFSQVEALDYERLDAEAGDRLLSNGRVAITLSQAVQWDG